MGTRRNRLDHGREDELFLWEIQSLARLGGRGVVEDVRLRRLRGGDSTG